MKKKIAAVMLSIFLISGRLAIKAQPENMAFQADTPEHAPPTVAIEQQTPVFPVSGEYRITAHYGFDNGNYNPYTDFEAKGAVRNILAGQVCNVSEDKVTVRSDGIEISYMGIKPLIKGGETAAPGEIIGESTGKFKIGGLRQGIPFDVMFAYFPNESIMQARNNAENRQKEKYLKLKKEIEARIAVKRLEKSGVVMNSNFDELFVKAGRENSIDPALLKSVAHVESGINPKAVSPKGAMGIMQLMPQTAQSLGVKDPFNPEENISAGAKHLKSLLEYYSGKLELALAAYNAGRGSVDKYGGVPPYEETQNYVKNVLSLYKRSTKAADDGGGAN